MRSHLTLAVACGTLMLASTAHAQSSAAAPPARPAAGQRVAVVTGSTDGLGREVAMRLAAQGWHVVVHGRNAERGAAVVQEIATSGRGSARFYRADFASLADVRRLAADLGRDYPRLDLLVPRSTVAEGAEAVLHAVSTDAPSGTFFNGQRAGTPHAQALDADARRQLRALSQKLTGLP